MAKLLVSEPFELAESPLTGSLRRSSTPEGDYVEFIFDEAVTWHGQQYYKAVSRSTQPDAWYGVSIGPADVREAVSQWRGGLVLRASLG